MLRFLLNDAHNSVHGERGRRVNDNRQDSDEATIDVGNQIRMLRDQRQLSQQALADASGVSRNTLSLIERGQTSPTVSTLKNLASALSVDISAFFQPIDDVRIVYTKSRHRPRLMLDHGAMADLGVGMLEHLVTPLLLQLDPGARSGTPVSHEGQDFIYCLKGEVLYSINGRGYVLETGDSIFFDGQLPHRFSNPGPETAELLIILSSPRDSAHYIAGHFGDDTS